MKKPNFNIYLQKNNAKISLEFGSACLPESVFQTTILHVRMLEILWFFDQIGYTQNIHRPFDIVYQQDQSVFTSNFFQSIEVSMVVAPLPLDGTKNMLVDFLSISRPPDARAVHRFFTGHSLHFGVRYFLNRWLSRYLVFLCQVPVLVSVSPWGQV